MTVQARTPRTKLLLSMLAAAGSGTVEFFRFFYDVQRGGSAYLVGGRAKVLELRRLRNEAVARRTLRVLQQNKYVRARRIGKRLMVELTDKGRVTILAQHLRTARPRRDGWRTVVIFDVPESERSIRRQLRLFLCQAGYKRLQQSVWVSRGDVYAGTVEFVRQARAKLWVNVFLARDFLAEPARYDR